MYMQMRLNHIIFFAKIHVLIDFSKYLTLYLVISVSNRVNKGGINLFMFSNS